MEQIECMECGLYMTPRISTRKSPFVDRIFTSRVIYLVGIRVDVCFSHGESPRYPRLAYLCQLVRFRSDISWFEFKGNEWLSIEK